MSVMSARGDCVLKEKSELASEFVSRSAVTATGHVDSAAGNDAVPNRDRDTWNRKIDFLLACIGFSVGLGNVWRFPYLCYKNGGGAFLIPYFTCVILGGIPVFFLEVALGQFMATGGIKAWAICPLFQGIGMASTVIVFLLNIYYNVILAWAFYYLFSSFTGQLPWSHCHNSWNTNRCITSVRDLLKVMNSTNGTVNSTRNHDGYAFAAPNASAPLELSSLVNISTAYTNPVKEFWERKVLAISEGIDEVGVVKWDLALCLLLAWIVVYFCIWKGVKTSGKVMYFTATSPYLLMFILLVRGVTLPGALKGIQFYLIPDWQKILSTEVWVDAGTQIFFSYSISLGTLTALGSYNKFHHNCWRDSMLFAICNSSTSFFAGFVIFSVLGFMATEQGVTVSQVAESGPGLAFIAYPNAIAQMPIAPLWSILFFFMVILLGLDSQFVGVEGFVTAISDLMPQFLSKRGRKEMLVGIVCLLSFIIGLSMVTNGGMYVFQLFDYYSGSRIILVVAFFECMVLSYCYGIGQFYDNIQLMLGFRLNKWMYVSWVLITPLFTLIMFGMCIYNYSELTYNRTYRYPRWAIACGWLLACSSVLMIPIVFVFRILTADNAKSLLERIKQQVRPKLPPHVLKFDELRNHDASLQQTVTRLL